MVKINNGNYFQRTNTERVRSVESDHIEVDYGSMCNVFVPKEERYNRTYYKKVASCKHDTDSDAIEADHSSMTETTSESGVSDLDIKMTSTDAGRCKCCPYGYHIDVDFMEFLNSVDEERTLKCVTRERRRREQPPKTFYHNENNRTVPVASKTSRSKERYSSHLFDYNELRNTLAELDKIVGRYIKDLEKHCHNDVKPRSSSADLLKQRGHIEYSQESCYKERRRTEKAPQQLLRTRSIPVSLNHLCTFQPKPEQKHQLSRVPPPIVVYDKHLKNHAFQKVNPLRVSSPEVFVTPSKLPPLFISESALSMRIEDSGKVKDDIFPTKTDTHSSDTESKICSQRLSPLISKRTVGVDAEDMNKKTSGVECPKNEGTRDVGILHRHKTPTREVGVLHKVEQSKIPTRDVAVVIRSQEIGKGTFVDERIEEIEGIYREKVRVLEKQLEEKEKRPSQRHVGLTHYPEVEDRALNTDNIRFGRDVALQYVYHPNTRDACTQFTTVITTSPEHKKSHVVPSRDFALNVNIPVKHGLRDVSTMVNFDRKPMTRDVGLGDSCSLSEGMKYSDVRKMHFYDACIDTSTLTAFKTTSTLTDVRETSSRNRRLNISGVDRATITDTSSGKFAHAKETAVQVNLLVTPGPKTTTISASTQHSSPSVKDNFTTTTKSSFVNRGIEACRFYGIDMSSNTEKMLMCSKSCSTGNGTSNVIGQSGTLHGVQICTATQTIDFKEGTSSVTLHESTTKSLEGPETSLLASQKDFVHKKISEMVAAVSKEPDRFPIESHSSAKKVEHAEKPVSGILKKTPAKCAHKSKKAIQFSETVKTGELSKESSPTVPAKEPSEAPPSNPEFFECEQFNDEASDDFGERSGLDEELYIACAILNHHLYEPNTTDKEKVQSALTVIQQDWFKASSHKNANTQTVVDYLIEFKSFSNFLLERIVNMADANGNTALHYSVSNGNWEIVNLLLDSGVCDVNLQNHSGYTASMLAAIIRVECEEQYNTIKRLFTEANVNVRATQNGQTALMLAVSHGIAETTRLLLECGAQVNLRDIDGSTSLMCAVDHGYTEIVRILLSRPECDVTVADNEGSTAMTIASQKNRKDILVLLYGHIREKKGHHPISHEVIHMN